MRYTVPASLIVTGSVKVRYWFSSADCDLARLKKSSLNWRISLAFASSSGLTVESIQRFSLK